MGSNRDRTWLLVIVLGAAVPIAVALGLFGYVAFTSTPLHSSPKDVPSVTRSTPSPAWGDAVTRGQQLARARLVEQNLPGLSVAVSAATSCGPRALAGPISRLSRSAGDSSARSATMATRWAGPWHRS